MQFLGSLYVAFLVVLAVGESAAGSEASWYRQAGGILKDSLTITDDPHQNVAQALDSARTLLYDDLERAKDFAMYGVDVAKSSGLKQDLALCYELLGSAHEIQGYLEEARNFYELAIVEALKADTLLAVKIRSQIGSTYHIEGNRGRAIEHLAQALQLARLKGYTTFQAECLTEIGSIYEEQGKFHEALIYYQGVVPLATLAKDLFALASTYQKIGQVHGNLGSAEASAKALRQAVAYFNQLNLEHEAIENKLELAEALLQLNRHQEAEELIFPHYSIMSEYLPQIQSKLHLLRARIALRNGDSDEAKRSLDSGFTLIEHTNREQEKSAYLSALVEYYVDQENYEMAYQFSQRREQVQDTLNRIKAMIFEEEAATRFKVQEKENELAIAVQQNLRSEREKNWLAALFIVSLLFLTVTISYASLKQRSNKTLTAKNAEIEKSLREKEILLREIHHRVKNNLQLVSSMLNMQARSTPAEEGAQALREGKNRIHSMALIHRDLYQAENIEGVSTSKYINRLCKSLVASYRKDNTTSVELITQVDDIQLDIDTIIPIGLILNELISNALKYAFADGEDKGKITVALVSKGEEITLIVKDNGRGISLVDLEFRKSMGFKLIEAFSKKLGGSFEVDNERGAKITIKFNVPQPVEV